MIVKHGTVEVADLKTKDHQWEFRGYDVHNVAYHHGFSAIAHRLAAKKYESDDVSGEWEMLCVMTL